jgi:phosphatidylinositol-bisphosphatase
VNDISVDNACNVKLLEYRRAELKMSDHKPVSALYNCGVRKVIHDKEQELYMKLLRELDRMENAEVPKVVIEPTLEFNFPTVRYQVTNIRHVTIKH